MRKDGVYAEEVYDGSMGCGVRKMRTVVSFVCLVPRLRVEWVLMY